MLAGKKKSCTFALATPMNARLWATLLNYRV